jgi:hypothetical protein
VITHWYLVKRNWPQAKAKNPFPLYAGLGGEVWPFDSSGTKDNKSRDLHMRMERSRTIVEFGAYSRFVCTDVKIAEEYFAAVKVCFGEAWLLQVAPPHIALSQTSGIDIGLPTGGYSVIEQELIAEGLSGPALNKWGLIQTLPEAFAYFEKRKNNQKLEQLDEMMVVSVYVLLKG